MKVEPTKGIVEVKIKEHGKLARIRSQMKDRVKRNITKFLYNNYDIMAYSPANMKEVSRKVITQAESKKEGKVVMQKKRNFALNR